MGEDMDTAATVMVGMVATVMARGLPMLSPDMEDMDTAATVTEDMEDTVMARGLPMPSLDMEDTDTAATVMVDTEATAIMASDPSSLTAPWPWRIRRVWKLP